MKGITIDRERYRTLVDGKPVELSLLEFGLLERLALADGRPVSRREVMRHVWRQQGSHTVKARTVDQHVARLRRKLGARYIRTLRLRGYSIEGNVQVIAS